MRDTFARSGTALSQGQVQIDDRERERERGNQKQKKRKRKRKRELEGKLLEHTWYGDVHIIRMHDTSICICIICVCVVYLAMRFDGREPPSKVVSGLVSTSSDVHLAVSLTLKKPFPVHGHASRGAPNWCFRFKQPPPKSRGASLQRHTHIRVKLCPPGLGVLK